MYHKNYSWKWSAISMLINTIDMTNWIWNVCTLLLLSLFQFLKKGKKGIYLLLFKSWYQLSYKKKQPTLFLDLSHDLFPPAKLSQHCTVDIFAAVIPQSKHKFSWVHASYCRCVWSWIGVFLEPANTRSPQCMLQDSTKSLQPLHVTKLLQVVLCSRTSTFSRCEVWKTEQQCNSETLSKNS